MSGLPYSVLTWTGNNGIGNKKVMGHMRRSYTRDDRAEELSRRYSGGIDMALMGVVNAVAGAVMNQA
jgi:hypothetical protein